MLEIGARDFYVEHIIVEHNIVEFNEKREPCNFGSDLNVFGGRVAQAIINRIDGYGLEFE